MPRVTVRSLRFRGARGASRVSRGRFSPLSRCQPLGKSLRKRKLPIGWHLCAPDRKPLAPCAPAATARGERGASTSRREAPRHQGDLSSLSSRRMSRAKPPAEGARNFFGRGASVRPAPHTDNRAGATSRDHQRVTMRWFSESIRSRGRLVVATCRPNSGRARSQPARLRSKTRLAWILSRANRRAS